MCTEDLASLQKYIYKNKSQTLYSTEFEAGWCSWLSRFLNTEEVLGSNPSLVIFLDRELERQVENEEMGEWRKLDLVMDRSKSLNPHTHLAAVWQIIL